MALTLFTLLRIHQMRFLTYMFSLMDRYLSRPKTIQPSHKIKIPALLSGKEGTIDLLFYEPPSLAQIGPRPVVINFHGGGWTFGTPQMDVRWAQKVVETGCVFISVGYRLAPKCAYPIPVEDCADAISWVYWHAKEHNLDQDKFVISGFSAGGNMAFSSLLRLSDEAKIKPVGIISFYPLLDRSTPDKQKIERNRKAWEMNSLKNWKSIWDAAYLGSGKIDLSSPYLSPGVASDQLCMDVLPKKITIFTCEWDTLCHEGELFRKRLASLGKTTSGRMIEESVHAFDRFPVFSKGNPKMVRMYTEALVSLKEMIL